MSSGARMNAMSGLLLRAVLMNGIPKASVFCEEHRSAAVRVEISRPGSRCLDKDQKTAENDRYITGIDSSRLNKAAPLTPIPLAKVSQNTLYTIASLYCAYKVCR